MIEDMTFEQLVASCQEQALNELMKGTPFGKIIRQVCMDTSYWRFEKTKQEEATKKAELVTPQIRWVVEARSEKNDDLMASFYSLDKAEAEEIMHQFLKDYRHMPVYIEILKETV